MPSSSSSPARCGVAAAAIVAVAVVLVPSGAHLASLANKMALPPAEYMIAQSAYAGWDLFGIAIVTALVLTLLHAWLTRGERAAFALSLSSFLLLAAGQAVFWTVTYPENVRTQNWTVLPADFEASRRAWEYSHAANAGLAFLALVLITAAALAARRQP